jgi:hypothetical protein
VVLLPFLSIENSNAKVRNLAYRITEDSCLI